MSNIVLSVENLSKQYQLGKIGTNTIQGDLAHFWAKLAGKENPNLKINETEYINNEYIWALKDINFEVKQGEILGIIGKNGAGKSTLLKILSKVTSPTKGQIKIKGKIASLLEVGTGFHPELTGKENIFLNGAILGMTKNDIKAKFDEIVDFSGVEKYIDTPVKRYSSGMYVRLAFAVAAHLEPEILIIDEVLAVGDAEFQKKCIGKIKNVAEGEGRTVLFVSHQMTSTQALCKQGIFLENGYLKNGVESIQQVVKQYLYHQNINNKLSFYEGNNAQKNKDYHNQIKLLYAKITDINKNECDYFKTYEDIFLEIKWKNVAGVPCTPNFQLTNPQGINVLIAMDSSVDWSGDLKKEKGTYISLFKIPKNLLNANDYMVSVAFDSHSPRICYESHLDCLKFTVWDSMDENCITRGMFKSVREDVVLWAALECSFEKID